MTSLRWRPGAPLRILKNWLFWFYFYIKVNHTKTTNTIRNPHDTTDKNTKLRKGDEQVVI
jgi:hypothetical protein